MDGGCSRNELKLVRNSSATGGRGMRQPDPLMKAEYRYLPGPPLTTEPASAKRSNQHSRFERFLHGGKPDEGSFSSRTQHAAAAVGQSIYSFGGERPSRDPKADTQLLNDLSCYNFSTGVWQARKPPSDNAEWPEKRKGHTLVATKDKTLVLFGGVTTIGQAAGRKTARSHRSTPVAANATRRASVSDFASTADEVAAGSDLIYFNDLWVYSPETTTWKEIKATSEKPSARAFHSADISTDGSAMYVFGGYGCHEDMGVWKFDLSSFTWTRLMKEGDLGPQRRYGHCSGLYNGCLYIFGGQEKNKLCDAAVWKLNIRNLEWTRIEGGAQSPQSRVQAAHVVIDDHWIIHGGSAALAAAPARSLDALHDFNFKTEKWRSLNPFFPNGPSLEGHKACILHDCDYIQSFILTGGGYLSGSPPSWPTGGYRLDFIKALPSHQSSSRMEENYLFPYVRDVILHLWKLYSQNRAEVSELKRLESAERRWCEEKQTLESEREALKEEVGSQKRVNENLEASLQLVRSEYSEATNRQNRAIDELERQKKEAEQAAQGLRSEVEDLMKKLHRQESVAATLEKSLKESLSMDKEIQEKIQELLSQKEELEKALQEVVVAKDGEISTLKSTIKATEEEVRKLTTGLSQKDEQVKDHKEETRRLQRAMKDSQSRAQSLEDELQLSRSRLKGLESEVQNVREAQAKDATHHEEIVATLERDRAQTLQDAKDAKDTLQAQLLEQRRENDKLKASFAAQLADERRQRAELNEVLDKEKTAHQSQINSLTTQFQKEKHASEAAAQTKLKDLKDALHSAHRQEMERMLSDQSHLQEELAHTMSQIDELNAEIRTQAHLLDTNGEELSSVKKKMKQLNEENAQTIDHLTRAIKDEETRLQEMQCALNNKEKRLQELQIANTKANEEKAEANTLNDNLRKFNSQLTLKLKEQQEEASRIQDDLQNSLQQAQSKLAFLDDMLVREQAARATAEQSLEETLQTSDQKLQDVRTDYQTVCQAASYLRAQLEAEKADFEDALMRCEDDKAKAAAQSAKTEKQLNDHISNLTRDCDNLRLDLEQATLELDETKSFLRDLARKRQVQEGLLHHLIDAINQVIPLKEKVEMHLRNL